MQQEPQASMHRTQVQEQMSAAGSSPCILAESLSSSIATAALTKCPCRRSQSCPALAPPAAASSAWLLQLLLLVAPAALLPLHLLHPLHSLSLPCPAQALHWLPQTLS
jgi:hypothetical protein